MTISAFAKPTLFAHAAATVTSPDGDLQTGLSELTVRQVLQRVLSTIRLAHSLLPITYGKYASFSPVPREVTR
jgi:hypothetical protein